MKNRFLLSLLLILGTLHAVLAQSRTVSGKVTGPDNSGMPGVNVIIKGTTTGTVTDANGSYSINVPGEDAVLVFSFIGMKSQEVTVGSQSSLDVQLQNDDQVLNEVVVTALGIERDKKALGVSVTELKADAVNNVRQTNFVNTLAGKVAGVRIQGTNGMVGSGSAIFIRGFTTFTGSNQPLFVVDGIPIDNDNVIAANSTQNGVSNSNRAIDINPDDIESISVLKGPAAAVLYGSRGASGAILITTKKGKAGVNKKNTLSFTSNYNLVEVNRYPDWQNEYAQGTGGVFRNNTNFSWGPKIQGQTVTNYLGQQEVLKAYPNNIKDLFRKGHNFQNTLTFSGANDKSNYLLSYSNLTETGMLENNRLERNSFRVNAGSQLTSKLNASMSVNYINSDSRRTQQGNQLSAPFFRTWFLPRSYNLQGYPIYQADGSQSFYDGSDNPLWSIANIKYSDRINRLIGNINLTYDLTSWLNLSYKLGTDAYTHNINTYDPPGTRGGGNHSAQGAGALGDRTIYYQENSSYLNLRASKEFGENIKTSFLLGNEINSLQIRDENVVGYGISIDRFDHISNTLTYFPASNISRRRIVGIYGQGDISYKEFLFMGFSLRNDQASTFGPKNRSYFYPSVNGSFVFTDAFSALKGNKVLSFGKIRANYARVGRPAPVYSLETYYRAPDNVNLIISDGFGPQINFPFRGQPGRSLENNLGNPTVGPEFTATHELGGEFRLFGNRVTLDLAYFSTRSEDIILNVPIAATAGYNTLTQNAGVLKSNGIEALINITPVKVGDFKWDISVNYSRIRNNVVNLAPGITSLNIGGFTGSGPTIRLEAGQPYGVIYGVKFRRDNQGNLLIRPNGSGIPGTTNAPGTVLPNADQIQNVGNANPNWTAGITNTFSYKGFSASFLLDIRQGGVIASRNIGDLRRSGAAAETADRERPFVIPGVLADPNDLTKPLLVDGKPVPNNIEITAEQYWGSQYAFGTLENYVFDGSWVRLREASLIYNMPKKLLGKLPFGALEIGLTGRNLLLWTKVPHIDPEVNLNGVSNAQGLEWNALPQSRTYGAILRVTF